MIGVVGSLFLLDPSMIWKWRRWSDLCELGRYVLAHVVEDGIQWMLTKNGIFSF